MTPAARAAERRRAERRGRGGKSRKEQRRKVKRERISKEALAKPALSRTSLPAIYKGAARFSADDERYGSIEMVRMARDCGLLDDVIEETTWHYAGESPGRKRTEHRQNGRTGSWYLAYLAFVNSGKADIRPWWKETYAELWWECGFDERPKYPTVRRRFIELEERGMEQLFAGTVPLIQLAVAMSGGRSCYDLVADCTEAETNARLHHDCREEDGCKGWAPLVFNRHGRRILPKDKSTEAPAASTAEAKAHRQEVNELPFDPDAGEDLLGQVEEMTREEHEGYLRLKIGGHWYRLLDCDAGVRAYTRGEKKLKFWVGYYNLKATDVFFGIPVINIVDAADEQEWNFIDELLTRIDAVCGLKHVRSLITDKGFAVPPVFEKCARHDITLVAPLRAEKGDDEAPRDRDDFDRDGIPRCKHCGGPTEFVRFSKKPNPRLWVRCARPYALDEDGKPSDACLKEQTVSCSKDWRYLLPLWRNTEAFQALVHLSLPKENAHHQGRRKNANGGNSESSRPRRRGRNVQQARAFMSTTLDWLKLDDRMGYLPGSALRVAGKDDGAFTLSGEDWAKKMEAERRAEGLNRPYGERAVKLGLGPLLPARKAVRNADTDEISGAPATSNELGDDTPSTRAAATTTARTSSRAERTRVERDNDSRDVGDYDWASGPPPPAQPPPDDELPF